MKKFLAVFVSTLVLFSVFSMNPIYSNAEGLEKDQFSGVLDLSNLEELEEDGQVTVEELTYEEFIKDRSKAKGITLAQAKKMYSNPNASSNQSTNTGLNSTQSLQTISNYQASSGYYSMHEININQTVTSFYKPTVQVFVWTYVSGSFREFKYIEEVDLDRDGTYDNYKSRQFSGKVKGKLTSSTALWWYVNGDFYDNGTTTVTGGAGGSGSTVGTTVTAEFSVSYQSNHYKYHENSGTYFAY